MRLGTVLTVATALAASAGARCVAQGVVVELRGREGAIAGAVERVGREGVLVKPDDPAQPRLRWISWDRVRQVRPEGGRFAEFAPLSDSLWRARTRLERGDLALAALDIERLTRSYPGLGGPSGTLLSELVLRLRLARGSHTGAAMALIRWSATRHAADATAAVWVGGSAGGAAAIDAGTGLAVQCPPMFGAAIGTPALEAFARSAQWDGFKAIDAATRDLAVLYRAAAEAELALRRQEEAAPPGEVRSNDPGVLLVRDVVLSRAGDASQRRAARESLEKRMNARPSAAVK
ncbi:MAG: hypothetical protein KIT68_10975, partial [Phycisphaeraceae bacterium]|nr:hypothetical protein [Phycisphaeraceae bacterium]